MPRIHARHARLPLLLPLVMVLPVAAACTPMSTTARTTTVASVDVARYLGTWYEIASVKQFFSVGLVNTTATYSLLPDGNIKVANAGRYLSAAGPLSTVVGSAVPVDPTNARLNVSFTGNDSAKPPGNYWVVALDPDYRWAVVSDPSGLSCFVLSRTPTISPELLADLLAQARAAGVNTSGVTRTPQG